MVFIVLFLIKMIYLSRIYSFKTDNKTLYKNELNFYMFFGFYFNENGQYEPDIEGIYTLDVNLRPSFTFDIIVAISTAIAFAIIKE